MGMLFRGVAVAAIVTVASWMPSPFSSTPSAAEADARCAPTVRCGSGCVARLANGFCMNVASKEFQARLGGVRIGPKFNVACTLCECWYIYETSRGTRRFKRTTRLICKAGAGGITTYGPTAMD